MQFGVVFGFAFLMAILDWIAVHFNWRRVEYFTKPSVMLFLLAWAILAGSQNPRLWWFIAALIFSLAADIFLLFSNRLFLFGLFFFLLVQLTYVLGLTPSFPPLSIASLALFILISLTLSQFYHLFSSRLRSAENVQLRKPLLIYWLAIGLMVFSALMTLVRPEKEWGIYPAILASTGALLFFTSDTLLAWNRFIQPLPAGKVLVMVTYHLAQFALIYAAVSNYA
jgi:uncharacterized membrane protein YhhN